MRFPKLGSIVSHLTWPTLVFGSLCVAQLGFESGISPGLWAFAITVLNLALIVVLEKIWPRKTENALQLDRRAAHDLAHGGLTQ